MSCEQNITIYEASFEDFEELYFSSDSFAKIVNELIYDFCDEYTKGSTALGIVFQQLWNNDCDLLVRDKRTAVEAFIMFRDTKKILLGEI